MDIHANKDIFVFIEQVDHVINTVSLELIGKGSELAKALGGSVIAILVGSEVKDLARICAAYGADKVILVDDPALEPYTTEPYVRAVTSIIQALKPETLLIGATAIGRDLAPRVSARVHTGLTADCTGLEIGEDGNLRMTRPAFGGNIMATIICPGHRPQMATVRPGVMRRLPHDDSAICPIEEFSLTGLDTGRNVEVLRIIHRLGERVNINEADVIVAGGRGMGGKAGFVLLRELADELGGMVAGSRAAIDKGWLPKEAQVGQTGKTVRPGLYIACGISGAIQHLAGMEESGVIIAINKDESAPIFEVADYGAVGDANKILPHFIQAVRTAKRQKKAI